MSMSNSSSSISPVQRLKSFKTLTYNIFFGNEGFDIRTRYIIKLIGESNVDMICLQEVTPRSLMMIQNAPWIDKYVISKYSVGRYGVVQLARKELNPKIRQVQMPTNMGRTLLCTEIHWETGPKMICTAHFESLDNHTIREAQLCIAGETMQNYKDSILMGDFNFCSYKNYPTPWETTTTTDRRPLENLSLHQLLPLHDDVWTKLHDTNIEKGYTFDSKNNSIIRNYEQMRYDRVLSKCIHYEPISIELIGIEEIPKDFFITEGDEYTQLHPSDHFGLLTTFKALDEPLEFIPYPIEDMK